MKNKKPKVGFYAITGCQGCLLSFIFNETELLSLLDLVDLKAFPFIKGQQIDDEFDIVFLEGVVCSNDDLEVLFELRKKTKILVALGACATTGGIPAYRNFTYKDKYVKLMHNKIKRLKDIKPASIDKYVSVDYCIPGCPPNRFEVQEFIKELTLGKTPRTSKDPVCYKCKLKNNHCLLDEGKICLGPITSGGCNSLCPSSRFECWGCRGPCDDPNYEEFIKMLKDKKCNKKEIKERLQSFFGTKLPNNIKI